MQSFYLKWRIADKHTLMKMRINKFLADHGVASRRAIDKLILEKRVMVNGVVLEKPGRLICDEDRVSVDGKRIVRRPKEHSTILLNKPLNCITTAKDPHGRKTVLDCVESGLRLFPIGRLDSTTTGALLLTNDGDLAYALMHPRFEVEKKYRAYIDRSFTKKDAEAFETGIVLDGKKTAPCTIRFLQGDKRDLLITLHEGKNRQIHRMLGALGYDVQRLERVSYAGLDVDGLKQGEWRHLTTKEVEALRQSVSVSKKKVSYPIVRP